MASRMTFSVPEKLKKKAQRRRDVNWSGVVTKAIDEKLSSLEVADRIAAKSRLTQEDVDEMADLIDAAMAKKFGVKS